METDQRLRYMWRRRRGHWKSAATGEMIPNGTEVMVVPTLEAAAEGRAGRRTAEGTEGDGKGRTGAEAIEVGTEAAESRRESEEDEGVEKDMEMAGTDGEEGEGDPFGLGEAMEEERKRREEGRRDGRREHGTRPGRSGGREAGGEGSEGAGTTGREGDREDEEEGGTGEGNDGAERQYEEQKLEQVREDMTNILEEEVWPEEQSSANGKREWTGRRLRAALYTRHGHKAGEHYGKRWLSNRAAAYMGLRRMLGKQKADATADEDGEGTTARTGTDRTGGAAEDNEKTERDDDPWWPSDLVKVLQAAEGGAGRRKWMVGRVGHLVRQARPGQWTVALEGERGCGEYDVEQEALEMAQRRAPTSGDLMACRPVDGGAEVRVQLTRRVEGSGGAEEWTAARLDGENFAQAEEIEEITVTMEGARRMRTYAKQGERARKARRRIGTDLERAAEDMVGRAQKAYAAHGDWRRGPMIAAMRETSEGQGASTEALNEAVTEAHKRWGTGPVTMKATTLNHGGIVVRLREAVGMNAALRHESRTAGAETTAAIVWQGDGRLYRTMKTLASENDVVMIQETHVASEDEAMQRQLRALLTTGEFGAWRMHHSPAPADDAYAGIMIWYNTEKVEMGEVETLVPGRIQRAKVRVLADGTKMTMLNVYLPARSGSPKKAELRRTEETRAQMTKAAEEADEKREVFVVAGDLQAQTARARAAGRGVTNEYDAWLEGYTTEFNLASVGEVEATYISGEGGSATAIDHWLMGAELMGRADATVGAGADGLHSGVEGEEGDRPIGREVRKGHNSLQLEIRLATAANEEEEEGEVEQREPQLEPMDTEEWEAYLGEEEAWIATADRERTDDKHGAAARRVEAIEDAAKELVRMTKEIDDQRAGGKNEETRQTRMHRQMLFWRKGLRQCDGHKARTDTHRMFNTEDCAGAFGKAPMADDRFKEMMEGSEPGADRRAKMAEECRRRYLEARGKYDGEIAEGAEDPDRVRTTLLAALDRSKEEGGNAQWEFFRAVGKAKAALAGKKTRPRDGKPGMTAVRRTGEAEPERGTQRVLSAIHDESQKMHQEGGASVAAVLWLVQQMEGAGLPLLTTPAVIDARTHAEATKEGQEASKAQARDEEERTRWREWRREHETRVARLQVLDAEETRTFARHLQGVMGQVMGDEALDEGMRRFREVQGVGLGGFKGIWIARASESTRERYKDALRGAAADVRIAAYELELATTPEERRHAIEAVRIAAPRGWVDWLVVLLTKPGKPLDVLSNRRDIYLQPHSLKLLMNGYTPQYDRAQRRGQPAANTGFRPKGSAPQTAMAMGLAREEAVSERRSWYRGYCDKGGFFQSVARRVQRAAERRCGVPADVTEVVMALHEALVVRYDSGKGLTPGTESKVGNGQGDSKGPTRSMEPLAIETRAIEWLVAGRSFRTPAGAGRRRVTQVWFADDGAFEVDSFSLLQVMFTVLSTMARALGFSVGIDKDKDGTPNGDKTGWTASEWEGNEHAEADDQTKVRLIDGREVPRAKGWYKHLGVRAQTTNGWGEARAVVVARCTGMAAALARLGIMSAEEYVDTVDTATLTVVAYYGAAFPLGRKACEDIDVAKRRGLERLGHAGTRAARWLVHSQRPEGLGMAMTWPHAAAALVVEMDNAYNAEAQAPARVAAAARTAKVYWQLGWRPTEEARVPLAWNPWHTRDMLSEESIIEAALKYRLTAGVATVAARGDGARNALADGYTTEEGASATLIWEAEGRKYGWRLARLGVTRRRHLYGGTERVARETEDGDIQEQGRWRTATEIGEAFGRGGHVIGGTRRGGRLTAAERAEYVSLLEGLDEDKEETDWVTGQRGPPEERPAEATVTEVVAAGKGRRGEREYWMRWSDGEEGWGRRPRTATAGMDREMGRAREAEGEGDLREALTKERGTAWVWLATQAPLAVGRR